MPSRRKIYEGSAASPPNRLKIIALLIVLVAGLAFYRFADRRSVEAGTFPTPVRFVGADSSALGFAPTIESKKAPPGAAPEGSVGGLREIRKVRIHRSTLPNRTSEKRLIAAVHSFAPTSIVPGTWLGRGAKEK